MSPSKIEALGLMLTVAGAAGVVVAAALVHVALAWLTGGILALVLGVLLVVGAARAPVPVRPEAGEVP